MAGEISKEELHEWYKNPVTERFIADFQDRVNSEMWELAENAGNTPHIDARTSGKIMAWGEVLNWKPQEFLIDEGIHIRDGGDDSDV